MASRYLMLLPLVASLSLGSALTEEGCGGEPTPTPTPVPTPTPSDNGSDKQVFDEYLVALTQAASSGERDALTNEFLTYVQYSDGFPIHEDNTVTFVYRQDGSGDPPYRVSGDFNDWSATANPLVQAVSGYGVYFATLTLPSPRTRLMYKFVGKSGGGDVWFADPVSRRYQYDSYGRYSLIFGGNQSQPSHLERYPAFYSPQLDNTRDLFLYLPPGYEQESETYPVLYMHDGQNLFDPNAYYGGWKVDQVIDSLLAQNKMREIIVVGMANTPGRMDEYTQVEDFLPAYGGTLGGDAPLYADWMVENLKPFIDDAYRTQPQRESTGVLGSSLGGLVSYYIGYAHSDVFRYVGGMSSTFGWGSLNLTNPTILHDLGAAPKLPNVYYVDSGGSDGGGCKDADGDGVNDDSANSSDNFCESAQMRDILKAKGHTSAELLYQWAPGAEHNEYEWYQRMHFPLEFWFPVN